MVAKCCRSEPRCRNCPARKIEDDRLLLALGIPPGPPVPAHLRGIPRSLHKYEPLLLKAWAERVETLRVERVEGVRPERAAEDARGVAAA